MPSDRRPPAQPARARVALAAGGGAPPARARARAGGRRARARELLARAREELLAALAPPACAACRAPLRGAHQLLCAGCRAELPWLTGPRCPRCGLSAPCGAGCAARAAAYATAWAPMAHDGPARALVAALKFRGALPVADLMAAQIAAAAPPGLLAAGAALVPVPSHPARRRARGFDQSERIAAALARRRGLALAACLTRGGAPTRQLGASRTTRLAAGRLAIAVSGTPPSHAVLVDDVHTTGATFEACARALRAAGCAHVAAVAYARTLPS